MTGADAIRRSPADNGATLLRPVVAGETLRISCNDEVHRVVAEEAIPLCHKISLERLAAGVAVIKYGYPIGLTLTAIPTGRHVHVHNMRSARAMAKPT